MTRYLSTAAIAALLPVAALADLTAQDIVDHYQNQASLLGLELSVTPVMDGDTMSLTNLGLAFSEKMTVMGETASFDFTIQISDYQLRENGDGTVSLITPESGLMGFAGSAQVESEPDALHITAQVTIEQQGENVVFSGTPDELVMNQSYDMIKASVTELNFDAGTESMNSDMDFMPNIVAEIVDLAATSTTRSGDMIVTESESSMGSMKMNLTMSMGDMFSQEQTQEIIGMKSTSVFTLANTPVSILNLSDTLRAGTSFTMNSTTESRSSRNVQTMFGELAQDQSDRVENETSIVRLDADGLSLDATFGAAAIEMLIPEMLPMPINVTAGEGSGAFNMPLLASDSAQSARVALDLNDLAIDETLFGLIDPTGQLPRDGLNWEFDIRSDLNITTDLLDFVNLIEMIEGGQTPVEPTNVRIETFNLDAVGASLAATMLMNIDLNRPGFAPDMPHMDGEAKIDVTGANGLIDKLIGMGLLTNEDAMGARMGMAMFAQPTGDDAFTSDLRLDENGGFFVNGQQMR